MSGRYPAKNRQQQEIVLERVFSLFKEAKDVFRKDRALANRYVRLAREMAMKYKVRMPSLLRRQFCKHCYSYLMPSVNARVRTRKGKVVYYCLECKKYMRFPYIKERKARRRK